MSSFRTGSSTDRDVDVEGLRDAGLEVRVEHHHPELDCVSGLVDGLVRLDEHRVALVHVLQLGAVLEVHATLAASNEPVLPRAQVRDLRQVRGQVGHGDQFHCARRVGNPTNTTHPANASLRLGAVTQPSRASHLCNFLVTFRATFY